MKKSRINPVAEGTDPFNIQNSQTSGDANQVSPDTENLSMGNEQQTNNEEEEDVAQFARFAYPTQNITLNANISNNQDFQAHLKTEMKEELFEKLGKTPLFPDEIFQDLPEILKLTCLLFPIKRERDLYLLGAITVLSGIMPNVSGTYDQKTVFPNLYLFIIAAAANGKGALSYAQILVRYLHEQLIELYNEKQQEYEAQLERFAESKKANKRRNDMTEGPINPNTVPPTSITVPGKPKRKMLLIPANSSSSSMMQILSDSDGTGIIFDTEADTLAESFNQKWGNFSDVLRKGFHHEPISSSRKGNEELIEIPKPKISVVLSGTLSQVKAIFHTAENGLVSRFMFYAFRNDSGWKDVSTINKENLTEKFNTIKDWVTGIYHYLNIHRLEFDLTDHQWQKLNEKFSVLLPQYKNSDGDVAGGMIVRLGLITFRIAMLFTALRKCENKDESLKIECSDTDFNIAMDIVNVLKEHSMFILDLLPDSELSDRDKNRKRLLDALPDNQFRRDTAVAIGKNLGIQKRTVDKYLKKLTLIGMLESIPFVGYKKIK